VHEESSKSKESGYTTTLKLMQIMHDKNLVTRDESSKSHVYMATESKSHTQKQLLHLMINNLFSGSPSDLILQALGNERYTEDDLEKIEQMINTLKQNK
jgi:predicted transcriptional regulator